MEFIDTVHLVGISLIVKLQEWLQNFSGPMIFFSHVGNPALAFTFFFPIAYCIHPSIGRRLMWVAVIAEWLNAVFKWVLHGERPYWWVHETNLYPNGNVPQLRQFNITCETGPGSPSGHGMVSSAVLYILFSDLIHYKQVKRKSVKLLCWTMYICTCVGICVSRIYIAAHFPHQVITGFVVGVILARLFNTVSTSFLEIKHYFLATGGMAITTVIMYYLILLLNFDPLWSVAKAIRWCTLKEWIHLNTNTFYAIIRDWANLLGLGFATWTIKKWKISDQRSLGMTAVQLILSLLLTSISDRLKVSTDIMPLFYALGFVQNFLVVFIIVYLVSLLNTMSYGTTVDST